MAKKETTKAKASKAKEQTKAPKTSAPATNGRPAKVDDVGLTVAMQMGSTQMNLDQALALGDGSLVRLDRNINDPVDVVINGKLVARGEVVTVGENFGVRITEIFEAA